MRIGTLFSGIGAPEQGAKRVYDNLEMVFACEFDKFARQSFQANYDIDEDHFHIDVNDMDGKQYKDKVDIIIGGSPCQAFSIAGLREGLNDKRGQLIWQYYRIIMEAQPEIFIYENVKGMVSDNNGNTLKDFLDVFRESGYFCHHAVLNTKDYGVPQNRERVYIVGFKDHELYHRFQFAPKIKLEKRLKDVLENDVDEKYYLSDKIIEGFLRKNERYEKDGKAKGFCFEPADIESYSSCLNARYFKCGAGDIYIKNYPEIKIEGMLNCKGTEQIRRVYGVDGVAATLTTMQGGNQEPKIMLDSKEEWLKATKNYGGTEEEYEALEIKVKSATKVGYEIATIGDSINLTHPDSKTRRGRVWVGIAQTLDCACNQAVVTERIRKLTPRECLRLQDFPDTFTQVVSNSQQYKQAGNSMSVNILEMIFRQIEKAKQNEPTNTLMDFL